jgi:tetratricopeptide (TPR) repeat protein
VTAHLPDDVLRRYNLNILQMEEAEFVLRHVDACPKCTAHAEHLFEQELRDSDIWSTPQVRAQAPDDLHDLGPRLAREDAEARVLLKDLLAAPAVAYEFIWSDPTCNANYLSGGVVRVLTELAHTWWSHEPLQALQFAEDAAQIAELLPSDYYPANLINLYRAEALKECASAQLVLARYDDALASLTKAERASNRLAFPGAVLGSINLARAIVLAKTKRFDAALDAIAKAQDIFSSTGDYGRFRDARIAEANIHDAAGDPARAREIVEPLYEDMSDGEPKARAIMANNLADYSLEMGDIANASVYLLTAMQLFESLGDINAARFVRWNVAYLALMGGRSADAIPRLRELLREFDAAGLKYEASLVKVDILAALIVAGSLKEATRLTREIFRSLQDDDVPTGAFTAAQYLKHTLRRRQLTPSKLDSVRRYLHQLRDEPQLLFRVPDEEP